MVGRECYSERIVWLECVGLHPKCWSFENFKMIGEKWGKTLHVDHEFNGVNNITCAKILVQTNTLHRIEECVRIEWQSGSCNVWVKDIGRCECENVEKSLQNDSMYNEPSKIIALTNKKVTDGLSR